MSDNLKKRYEQLLLEIQTYCSGWQLVSSVNHSSGQRYKIEKDKKLGTHHKLFLLSTLDAERFLIEIKEGSEELVAYDVATNNKRHAIYNNKRSSSDSNEQSSYSTTSSKRSKAPIKHRVTDVAYVPPRKNTTRTTTILASGVSNSFRRTRSSKVVSTVITMPSSTTLSTKRNFDSNNSSANTMTMKGTDCISTISPNSSSIYVNQDQYRSVKCFTRNGFVIMQMPDPSGIPELDLENLTFEEIFNTHFTSGDRFHVGEKFGRYQSKFDDSSVHWHFLEDIILKSLMDMPTNPIFNLVVCSILGRNSSCDKQAWHRDGDSGYFLLVPLTNDYIIRVVPGSSSALFSNTPIINTNNNVEYLNINDVEIQEIKLNKGEMFFGLRELVHSGGPSKTFNGINKKKNGKITDNFTDIAYHAHVETNSTQDDCTDKKQTVRYVQFFDLVNP